MNEFVEITSPEEYREKLKDPNYLPSAEDVKKAFPGSLWNDMSTEWFTFLRENACFQLVTKELVQLVSDNLRAKINSILEKNGEIDAPIIVLELGAGNGRLLEFVRRDFEEKGIAVALRFIATDDFSWHEKFSIGKNFEGFPVEDLSADRAVEKYGQQGSVILLSSWMPPEENWTVDFLSHPNVKTFLLIGDIAATGKGNQTWFPDGPYQTEQFGREFDEGNYCSSMNYPGDARNNASFAFVTKI